MLKTVGAITTRGKFTAAEVCSEHLVDRCRDQLIHLIPVTFLRSVNRIKYDLTKPFAELHDDCQYRNHQRGNVRVYDLQSTSNKIRRASASLAFEDAVSKIVELFALLYRGLRVYSRCIRHK